MLRSVPQNSSQVGGCLVRPEQHIILPLNLACLGRPKRACMCVCVCPSSWLQLHYQHQVIQDLHELWQQYSSLPLKTEEARVGQEDPLSSRVRPAPMPLVFLEKTQGDPHHLVSSRSPVMEAPQLLSRQGMDSLREHREPFLSQKTGTKSFPRKSIMEEILVEESPDMEPTRSPWELESLPLPKWNLCLEDFRKVPTRL